MRKRQDASILPRIIAYARAGALEQAWRSFRAGGYDQRRDDPAVLSVKGRLLKDRAVRIVGKARQQLLREAAAAYAQAAALNSSTYPLINAATLSLLGGDTKEAAALAEGVLQRLREHPEEPETPYYRYATEAEALLVLGGEEKAQTALAEAISLAPRAWEDHASTLRQFKLILEAQGRDTTWLERHRPPRSLHFGGHMSFDPKVVRREHLDWKIAEVLEEERVGFGYGALAAGADIIIAEALLERGAEVHAVLPGGVESFAARSVDPFGAEWRRRFDAVLSAAETMRPVRPLGTYPDAITIALADEIAMGSALMNAQRLESSAVQLLVVDSPGASSPSRGATARSLSRWAEGGWRQRLLPAPREAVAPRGEHQVGSSSRRRPLAILAVAVREGREDIEDVESRLAAVKSKLTGIPPPSVNPYWAADQLLMAHDRLVDAASCAVALAADGHQVGGHYAVAAPFSDPFSGAERLPVSATAAATAACQSTPGGSTCVTDDFAAALAAAGSGAPPAEFVGELEPPDAGPAVALYALKPRL